MDFAELSISSSTKRARSASWAAMRVLAVAELLPACGALSQHTTVVDILDASPMVRRDVDRVLAAGIRKLSRCADPISPLIRSGSGRAHIVMEVVGETWRDIEVSSAQVTSRFGSEFNSCVETALRGTAFVPASGHYSLRVSLSMYIDSDKDHHLLRPQQLAEVRR